MCQDEDENEPEDEFFRSFRIKTVTNEPGPQYYDTLKDRFVRHAQVPERTKALVFVFVFVFVLAHEQAIIVNEIFFFGALPVDPEPGILISGSGPQKPGNTRLMPGGSRCLPQPRKKFFIYN